MIKTFFACWIENTIQTKNPDYELSCLVTDFSISPSLSLSLSLSLFRHRSGTYQRVINDEAKSCRCQAKRYSRGYNPVNFRTGAALPPVQWRARKPVVRCFAHGVRRDVFPGINCCFGVCLRPNYAAATQWDKPEILPLHREKLCDQRGCNAASSTIQPGWQRILLDNPLLPPPDDWYRSLPM